MTQSDVLVESDTRDAPVDRMPPSGPAAALSRVLRALPAIVGVLIPTLLFARFVWHQALAFDGGLNYQVVESLVKGHGYVRPYDGTQAFPQEIETSGPFLFLGALFVWLFGDGPSVMQLANIVFLGILAGGIAYFLRGHRVAQLFGPTVALFLVPGMATFGFHGYGEVAVAAVGLVAMLLLGSAFGDRVKPFAVHLAFVSAGVAFTIKVIGIVCVPVVVAGYAMLLMLRPDSRRLSIYLAPLSAAVAPALFELYRLISLGSLHSYMDFWHQQRKAISAQAVHKANGTLLQKGLDHIHLLSKQTGVSSGWLVLWLALPFVVLAATFLTRTERWTDWLRRTDVATMVMVALYTGLYDVWWVFLTPTEKAWLRRFLIGFIFTNVLLLRLGVHVVQRIRESRLETRTSALRRYAPVAVGLAMLAVLAASVPALWTPMRSQAQRITDASDAGLRTTLTASEELKKLAHDGYYPVGIAWWAAPVVSVQANVPLTDLKKLNPCGPEWAPRISAGRVVVVWDQYAYFLAAHTPVGGPPGLSYTLLAQPNNYASFWTVSFSKPCP